MQKLLAYKKKDISCKRCPNCIAPIASADGIADLIFFNFNDDFDFSF